MYSVSSAISSRSAGIKYLFFDFTACIYAKEQYIEEYTSFLINNINIKERIMSLTKREIANQVASMIGSTKSDAAAAVQATLDIMAKELAAGGHIELRGFGVFEVKVRKASVGRNPRKPEESVTIPERKVVKFRAGRELAEILEQA